MIAQHLWCHGTRHVHDPGLRYVGMQEAGTRTVGQGAALLDALRKYVRTARLRHFIFTCQHSAAPASRASTFSGSCGSDCDESVHMAATRPGSRRATRRAGRDPPGIRSAVAVVMALKTNQEARILARRSRQQDALGGKIR